MYSKFQIALLYFPHMMGNPKSAVNRLRREIAKKPELLKKLQATGYRIHAQGFDLEQINLLIQAFGRPKGL